MPDDHTSSPEPVPSEGWTAGHRIRVLLPLPLPEALDYLVTGGSAPPEPGTFVRVPLGQRNLAGVVWDGAGDELPVERLKPILEILPGPALRPELRRFVERVAAYTTASPAGAAALAEALSGKRLPRARRRVLELLRDRPPVTAAELARFAGCGAGVIRDLLAAGLVEERFASAEPPEIAPPDWRLPGPTLSPDQSIAAQRLVDSVEADGFAVTVLDGVTGSGKSETYFAAIAAALAAGRQVLVLLPEIALGAQW